MAGTAPLPVPGAPGSKNGTPLGDRRRAPPNTSRGLLKDALEVVKVPQPGGGRARYSIRPLDEELPFDKGLFVFIRAIQTLTAHNKGVVMVGLAGPSGSGKTVFSHKVQSLIPGCVTLSMDDYNDASRLVDGNFDDPRLTDYDTLLRNVADLKDGRAAQAPIYDFKASRRVGYREVPVPAARVVIIEGIYALSSRIRPLLDLRVSVTGGVHFDLVKRVLRDITRSGQQPEAIIQQITDTVYPMYKAYIEPDLRSAHLRIYNPFNPFTGFMDATYILKSDAPASAESVRAVLAPDHASRHESETYDIYLLPPNEDPETCSSWLRMRNRDGRYSLMFEEWVVDGPFIISPRITFEVSVRVLGGLMALGYEIGTIMKRTSRVFKDERLTIKLDAIEGMGRQFVQIQGKDRDAVAAAGSRLGLDGTYIARSYIEMVQLEKLTECFRAVTDDLRKRFAVGGEPLFDSDGVGTPPSRHGQGGSLFGSGGPRSPATRTTGFAVRSNGAASAPAHGDGAAYMAAHSKRRSSDQASGGGGSGDGEDDGSDGGGLAGGSGRSGSGRGGSGDGGRAGRTAAKPATVAESPSDAGVDVLLSPGSLPATPADGPVPTRPAVAGGARAEAAAGAAGAPQTTSKPARPPTAAPATAPPAPRSRSRVSRASSDDEPPPVYRPPALPSAADMRSAAAALASSPPGPGVVAAAALGSTGGAGLSSNGLPPAHALAVRGRRGRSRASSAHPGVPASSGSDTATSELADALAHLARTLDTVDGRSRSRDVLVAAAAGAAAGAVAALVAVRLVVRSQ